jgi:hypothetical protein
MEMHSIVGALVVLIAILLGLAAAPFFVSFAGTKAAV